MAKFYAVAKGKNPGVYRSWDEAKEQVHGVKGTMYKSFDTLEEAQWFIEINKPYPLHVPGVVYAWVDGSNLADGSKVGCGMSIEKDGEEIAYHMASTDKDSEGLRNILGELSGALMAIEYMKRNNLPGIFICHDYIGVGGYPNGYSVASGISKQYADYVNKLRAQGYDIKFIKVKAHEGNLFNERADWLAKKSIGIEKGEFNWEEYWYL